MGQHGYGIRNERRERLIQYACEHRLSIMNTFFKKKPSRRWTWISPGEKIKNEVDYIMCNKPKISNLEVLNKVNFSWDHRLVRASFGLVSPKLSRKNFKLTTKSLKTEREKTNYLKVLEENLSTQSEILDKTQDVQTFYDNLEKPSFVVSKRKGKVTTENTKYLRKKHWN